MSTTNVARSLNLRTPTPTADVERAVAAGAAAFGPWSATRPGDRASALRRIAQRLDETADHLISIGTTETHLPDPRLRGELRRTTFQLGLFADLVDEGRYLDVRIDHADPQWPLGVPRPDLRRMLRPLGPVVVFAASNFPFAFSVAGGDAAAALAAGCPVILKAHSGHLGLSEATAEVVIDALREAGAPEGVFTAISGVDAGVTALGHPLVKAGAFTGSIHAGRRLFDVAQSRPEPIPFYGELGSINPAFITRSAIQERSSELCADLVTSFSGSSGQLCTKPGIVLVPAASPLIEELRTVSLAGPAPLLNQRVVDGYTAGMKAHHDDPEVHILAGSGEVGDSGAAPVILATTAAHILNGGRHVLDECFGPVTVVVEYTSDDQMTEFARQLDGQLTATVHGTDTDDVSALVTILTEKAGRVLWNDWPTGVAVTYAQQHGGPYPSSTTPTTSVGTAAIERFLRPVAFQNLPDRLLPEALRDSNPMHLPRLIDGTPEATR